LRSPWSAAGSRVWRAWPGWPGATATCGTMCTLAAEEARRIDGHTAGAWHIRKLPPYDRHFRDGQPRTAASNQPVMVLGWVMAVPTTTANAPVSAAARACSGV